MNVCPTFGGDGPSGIAEALRVVDCMSGQASSFAFGRLFGSHALLGQALTAALTLYIAFYAIGLLTGRASLSVANLTPRMMTLGIALTFATSWIAYQSVVWNLLVGAPDEIAGLLIGTQGSATSLFADRLDVIFGVVAHAAATAQTAVAKPGAGSLASGPDLLWLSALLLLLGTVGVLLVAKIALAALLALGPIFIICGLFEGSRGLFEGWLKAAVLFALAPLLAVLIGGGTIALLNPIIESLAGAGAEVPLRLTTTLFLASAVYCALMLMTLKIAGTMVAGWRIPFSRTKAARSAAAFATTAGPEIHSATAPSGAASNSRDRDPRVHSIVNAATGGLARVDYGQAAPFHAATGRAPDGEYSPQARHPTTRVDPRLGSLSRHYRPRLAQLQRSRPV